VGGISTETDPNGNMVSVPGGAYTYDAQNRLTTAIVNGVTTEFTYDSRNRVVQRTSGNGTLNLTYSGWHLIEERNATGALEQVYVHGAGTDEILVKITTSGPAYYHHDGLVSTIALTGENGALLESYRYDAFGAASVFNSSFILQTSSLVSNRFLFTGREWLSQVGLYDYRNRVYSAQIGRFLQTDPIRFSAGDVNIYRYCGNNAVNWADPTGKFGVPGAVIGGISGAIAGGIGASITGGGVGNIVAGAVIGGVGGAISGSITGGFGQVVAAGAAIGALTDVAGQLHSGKSLSNLNGSQVVGATIGGGLSGLAGGVFGKLGSLAGGNNILPNTMSSIAGIPLSIVSNTLGTVAGGCK
jgi:RHS repeat-associated protein